MLAKSSGVLDIVTQYTKQADGSWHGDLTRPIRVHVTGRSPGECKWKVLEAFDEVLAEWLQRVQQQPAEMQTGGSPLGDDLVLTDWLERIQKQPTVVFGSGAETAIGTESASNS